MHWPCVIASSRLLPMSPRLYNSMEGFIGILLGLFIQQLLTVVLSLFPRLLHPPAHMSHFRNHI
jgi:hypothetical protein